MLTIPAVLIAMHLPAFCGALPENLRYDLTLNGVKVGTAALESRNTDTGTEISFRIISLPWVSVFYEVDDSTVSKIGTAVSGTRLPSTSRVLLREGKTRVSKDITFDHKNRKITYVDHIRKEKSVHVFDGNVFDALSAFNHIRNLPLRVGQPLFITVFNNRNYYRITVEVLRTEKVQTPAGEFRSILLRSNMEAAGDGIFYSQGDIYVWLTDDHARLPVIIEKRLNAFVEGKLPEFLKDHIPVTFRDKLMSGTVRAVLVKK